ncbi:hypothetical protein ILYODFUR_021702 [Ilyodon furcidens]|uniref:Uncharacterized protein n=1 Tax=Ilyodon furcidens TaxID=33524 RepID=A0ABV0UWA8_9TELE
MMLPPPPYTLRNGVFRAKCSFSFISSITFPIDQEVTFFHMFVVSLICHNLSDRFLSLCSVYFNLMHSSALWSYSNSALYDIIWLVSSYKSDFYWISKRGKSVDCTDCKISRFLLIGHPILAVDICSSSRITISLWAAF